MRRCVTSGETMESRPVGETLETRPPAISIASATRAVAGSTMVPGILTAVWVETNEVLLAAFMAGIAVTYALAEFVHVEEPVGAPVTRGQLAHHS